MCVCERESKMLVCSPDKWANNYWVNKDPFLPNFLTDFFQPFTVNNALYTKIIQQSIYFKEMSKVLV